MNLWRGVLLLILPALAAHAAEPVPADLLPPGTHVLLGCDIRSLVESPLFKGLNIDPSKARNSLAGAPAWPGVNPLKDLDSIVLAADGTGKDARGLAVLRGRFPTEPPKNARMYHGVPLLEDPKDPTRSLAVLNSGLAIAGTAAEVRAAIDRRGRSAPAPKVAARFVELGASYDFWGVGDMPEGITPRDATTKALQSIDRFEFGATLRDGLRFRGEVHVKTAEQAAEMQSSLKMVEAMLRAQSAKGEGSVDLRVENSSVKLELFVPEAELRKALAAQKDSLAGLIQNRIRPGNSPVVNFSPARPVATTPPAGMTMPTGPSSPGAIVTNQAGDTVTVTLPGGR